MIADLNRRSSLIKKISSELGFSFCGISKAEFLEEEAARLEDWLKKGHHGKMSYMENHFDKRLAPGKLVPGAKSVISLLYNYFPKEEIDHSDNYRISKYAYGKDYHFVIKDRLKNFVERIREEIGDVEGRFFVDSAPVMERAWAKKSGLGWIGKHTLLINKDRGSFFFLAEIISDLELEPDGPVKDYCGTCTRCMDACPTDAFPKPYELDASKCISYLTIELKEEISPEFKGKMNDWMFGCDICQDVCPWNRFSRPHSEPAFDPSPDLKKMSKKEWNELTEEVFQKVSKKSPMKRTKLSGLRRNIKFLRND